MKRKPTWKVHHFDRDHRYCAPRDDAIEGKQDTGENVGLACPTVGEDCLPRLAHVQGFGRIADDFQREVRLDAGA